MSSPSGPQYVIPEWACRGSIFFFLDSGQDHAGMTPGANVGRIPRMRRFTDRSGNNPYTLNIELFLLNIEHRT